MACSAVVIELPNGVFITMMPLAVAAGMSTLSTPMPARPMTFSFVAFARIFAVDLGGRADGEAVIVADDLGELVLVLAEVGLEVDLDAAILEDLHGGGRQRVGNENFGLGVMMFLHLPWRERVGPQAPGWGEDLAKRDTAVAVGDDVTPPRRCFAWRPSPSQGRVVKRQAAFASAALVSAKAQSSHGVSASTSAVSTVAPHQMRRPGGASR